MDFAVSVTAALDELLMREGFAARQCGADQTIYCAGHDWFSDRYAGLPQANAQPRGLGCCVDLVIDHDGEGPRLTLEGVPLGETLRALRLNDDADAVDGLAGMPFEAALDSVAAIIPRFFRAAAA